MVAGVGGKAPGANAPQQSVPFLVGSNHYSEKMFTDTFTPGASGVEYVHNVTPGGFLRGIRLIVRSSGGVIGSGVAAPDFPWSLFSSISVENIDGSPILYPMSGYAYYLENKYSRPWLGEPTKRDGYSNGVNPAFVLYLFPELRDSAGALANTDARAQYRIRYTVAPSTQMFTTAPTTLPSVNVQGYLETWSQTDQADLHGNPIAALPPGLAIGRIVRHDVKVLNSAGASNLLQFSNTGNEIRNIICVVRDANGVRQDYLTDPIRFRLDDRSEWTRSPDDLFAEMNTQYPVLANGVVPRETGVYVIPRFRDPGSLTGEFWLPTSNATYVLLESSTLGTGTNLPGTVEIITDEIVPIASVPFEFEGI